MVTSGTYATKEWRWAEALDIRLAGQAQAFVQVR